MLILINFQLWLWIKISPTSNSHNEEWSPSGFHVRQTMSHKMEHKLQRAYASTCICIMDVNQGLHADFSRDWEYEGQSERENQRETDRERETARKRSRVDEKVPRERNTSSEVIWSWSGNRVQRPEGDNQEKKSKGSDKLFLAVCSRSIILHSQVSSKHLSLNGSPIIWALHSFNYPHTAFI